MKDTIIIFSDGSSRGNPGPGGWGAIVETPDGIVVEHGGREEHTTNNRMELTAAIEALRSISTQSVAITIYTDSSYVIQGITKWIYAWQKNNWISTLKAAVVNRDLWEELLLLSKNKKILWQHVSGHAGIPGNERCDAIATSYAQGITPSLFHGKKSGYTVKLSDLSVRHIPTKSKPSSSQPAYSYISIVDGKIMRHSTWAACEKRVKGVKGDVRFKKAMSEAEEKNIIAVWRKN